MKGGLAYALAQLSDRERWLLAVFALVAAPVGVIFLAVLPMLDARDAAQRQAREAEALLAWVADQVRVMPEDAGPTGAEASAPATLGIAAIEDSLVAAGLRDQVAQLANRGDGGVDLSLQDAPFDLLSQWLRQMEGRWGYRLAAFRFEASDPGLVNAVFELAVP